MDESDSGGRRDHRGAELLKGPLRSLRQDSSPRAHCRRRGRGENPPPRGASFELAVSGHERAALP